MNLLLLSNLFEGIEEVFGMVVTLNHILDDEAEVVGGAVNERDRIIQLVLDNRLNPIVDPRHNRGSVITLDISHVTKNHTNLYYQIYNCDNPGPGALFCTFYSLGHFPSPLYSTEIILRPPLL